MPFVEPGRRNSQPVPVSLWLSDQRGEQSLEEVVVDYIINGCSVLHYMMKIPCELICRF